MSTVQISVAENPSLTSKRTPKQQNSTQFCEKARFTITDTTCVKAECCQWGGTNTVTWMLPVWNCRKWGKNKQKNTEHYEYTRVTGGKTSLSHGRLTGELQRTHWSDCKLSYLDQITLQDETWGHKHQPSWLFHIRSFPPFTWQKIRSHKRIQHTKIIIVATICCPLSISFSNLLLIK